MNSVYFRNCVAGNVFGTKTTPALPAAYYLGLSTTAPSADGTNVTEPTGGAYARVQLTSLSEPTEGKITNANSVSFPESTQSWGTITHYAIFDAATEGNLLMFGEMTQPRNVEAATTMVIKENTLELFVLDPTT